MIPVAHLVCPILTYCLASHSVRIPCLLLGQSFCQDSMHCGISSGLDVLIREWVPLRDHWTGLHVVLCMSGTWSGHPNRQQYAQETCGRLWCIIRDRCPNQKMGCNLGVTRCSCGSDNR